MYAGFRMLQGNTDGNLCVPEETQEARCLKDDEKLLEPQFWQKEEEEGGGEEHGT